MAQHGSPGFIGPGRHPWSVAVGSGVRTAVLHVPQAAADGRRLPLVLDLHGSGSGPVAQLAISGFDVLAERYGFVVVAPQGGLRSGAGYAWHVPHADPAVAGAPDEEAFLGQVVDALVVAGLVDPDRVYATGMSGGGRMVCQLAGDHPDRFAAVAVVAGLRAGAPSPLDPATPDRSTWSPTGRVPVLAVHGTADPVNPYAGGGPPYWGYSVPAALARWAEVNRARGGPTSTAVTEHVRLLAYDSLVQGADTRLYVVDGGGHTWPGSRAPFPPGLGPVSTELDATDAIWRFFSDHLH